MGVRTQYKHVVHENSPIVQLMKQTNDYTIYTHFLGRELKFKEMVLSPLREDSTPTFNIFPARDPKWDNQILFKDFNGDTGNVIGFVERFAAYNYNIVLSDLHQTIAFIRHHLGLDTGNPVKTIHKAVVPENIDTHYGIKHGNWTAKHLEYWEDYGINKQLLEAYSVYPVEYLLNQFDQIVADFRYTLTFVYWLWDKFKLYQPYEENFVKFFMHCPKNYVQGMAQCKQQTDSLLITKSMKDIMTYQAHTPEWIDAIAPHGEGYISEENMIYWILSNYKHITIIYDPDYAGVCGARRLRNQLRDSRFNNGHTFRVRFVSNKRIKKRGKLIAPVKDIADYRLIYGETKTISKINELLYG